jgi:hypothetical protein
MTQAGITDPARVFADMLAYMNRQRRVDFALGLGLPASEEVNIVIPIAAMKINYVQLVDAKTEFTDPGNQEPTSARLNIVLDSLAARYTQASFRIRSHPDQLEIDATDLFFQLTTNASRQATTLYWGKATPAGGPGFGPGYYGGGFGGFGGGGYGFK